MYHIMSISHLNYNFFDKDFTFKLSWIKLKIRLHNNKLDRLHLIKQLPEKGKERRQAFELYQLLYGREIQAN